MTTTRGSSDRVAVRERAPCKSAHAERLEEAIGDVGEVRAAGAALRRSAASARENDVPCRLSAIGTVSLTPTAATPGIAARVVKQPIDKRDARRGVGVARCRAARLCRSRPARRGSLDPRIAAGENSRPAGWRSRAAPSRARPARRPAPFAHERRPAPGPAPRSVSQSLIACAHHAKGRHDAGEERGQRARSPAANASARRSSVASRSTGNRRPAQACTISRMSAAASSDARAHRPPAPARSDSAIT